MNYNIHRILKYSVLAFSLLFALTGNSLADSHGHDLGLSAGISYGPNTRDENRTIGLAGKFYGGPFYVGFSLFEINNGNGEEPPSGMLNYQTPHSSYVHHSTVIQDEFGMKASFGYRPYERYPVFIHLGYVLAEVISYDVKRSTATGLYYKHNHGGGRKIDSTIGFGATYHNYGNPFSIGIEYDEIRGVVGSLSWVWSAHI